jgi:hypothetical protein
MEDDPQTTDPDGRMVAFDAGSHLHLALGRPWLLDHIDAIMATIELPDVRAQDPIPGRERFYRRHIAPNRWLRVVVDFNDSPAWVVTATVQSNDPRERL